MVFGGLAILATFASCVAGTPHVRSVTMRTPSGCEQYLALNTEDGLANFDKCYAEALKNQVELDLAHVTANVSVSSSTEDFVKNVITLPFTQVELAQLEAIKFTQGSLAVTKVSGKIGAVDVAFDKPIAEGEYIIAKVSDAKPAGAIAKTIDVTFEGSTPAHNTIELVYNYTNQPSGPVSGVGMNFGVASLWAAAAVYAMAW